MNAEQLKAYLVEDVERIEKLLEEVGCHRIWRSGDEIRSAPPEGNNHTSVSVNIDTLYCKYYREGETFRGDIFQLIGLFRKEGFKESFRFTRTLFGLSGKFTKEKEKRDPLATFKNIRKQNRTIEDIKELEIPKFGRESIRDFIMLPHLKLFHEGITLQTQEIFNICYDPITDRIIFPHFAYDDINAIVGITGRTLKSDEEMKELLIPKYWNFIKGYKKMYNLYGFSHSLPFIIKNNMIIVFEAEKSVMKQWSQTRNEGFSVSTGGHELSSIQVQIILQNTPPDVEVVIAFDKDVMTMKHDKTGEHIGEQFLIDTCKKFSKYRKASYIYDTYNILGEKDSPIDKGVKIFNHLLKYRKTL
ncbi:toprim domain-containing protein [Bacillus cereus]